MIRRIRHLGEPVLRRKAAPVGRVTREIEKLIADLFETMDAAQGIGLAAPQVGVGKRVIVTNVPEEDGSRRRGAYVNPEIVAFSGGDESCEEGCLSVPGVTAEVVRPHGVEIRALDEAGHKIRVKAEGLFARCLQHEIDHLDGELFVDRAGMSESEARAAMAARSPAAPARPWIKI